MSPKHFMRCAAVASLSLLFACGPQDLPGEEGFDGLDETGEFSSGLGASISVHLKLGLPDSSTTSTSNPNHYLSVKHQYVISYNAAP